MAREYAQIKLSIWSDDDWRDLSPLARYLYITILTSPTLSHCGVADWRPARISGLNGMSIDEIEEYGTELVESLHFVIDDETEEVLVRSFVRNDGLMKQPKMAVAMATAHAAVASKAIRGIIVHEAKRLREDFPELNGWGSERATNLLNRRSVDPSTYPLVKGSTKGKPTPIIKGSTKECPTPAPTPNTYNLSPVSEIAEAIPDEQRPEVKALCDRLAKAIEANGSTKPTVSKGWLDAARLMLDKDNRTVQQIEWLIDWSQDDEFWRANILSMPTLRKQFDQLRLKAVPETAAKPKVDPNWALK